MLVVSPVLALAASSQEAGVLNLVRSQWPIEEDSSQADGEDGL